jgi:hypothetical protein
MMDFGQGYAIGYDRVTKALIRVRDNMGGIEQDWLR